MKSLFQRIQVASSLTSAAVDMLMELGVMSHDFSTKIYYKVHFAHQMK